MTGKNLLSERLDNQQLGQTKFKEPVEVVSWFGAMQGQDFEHVKWAIGTRLPKTTISDIEQSITQGTIIRSWLLRGTLHVAAAADIHWMLDLLAPRILAANAPRYRQLELDNNTLNKSNARIIQALQRNEKLTRDAIADLLKRSGIAVHNQRLIHLLQYAALKKIICFGSKQDAKFTFTLLDNCVPQISPLSREESLGMLALRYFQSHGPATLTDFAWWSGLNKTTAATAIATAGTKLIADKIKEQTFWRTGYTDGLNQRNQEIFFLPAFDELIIGYRDRNFILQEESAQQVISKNGIFYPVIMKKGNILGTWKRTFNKAGVLIEPRYFHPPTKEKEIIAAANLFGRFTKRKTEFRSTGS